MKRRKPACIIPEPPISPQARESYKYYALRKPLDDFNYPRIGCEPPLRARNFAWRTYVEDGRFRAWGEIEYPAPLDGGQMEAYDLAPSRDNPDMRKKIERQTQALGELEDDVPLSFRLTWWDFSCNEFHLQEHITPEQLEARLESLSTAAKP